MSNILTFCSLYLSITTFAIFKPAENRFPDNHLDLRGRLPPFISTWSCANSADWKRRGTARLGMQLQPNGRSHSRGNRTERVNGIFFEETRRTVVAIVADLRRDHCIDGLILG
jgi:hypothetical protein